MKKLRTHYDNLKVSRRATDAEIRQSYRRLASLHHPDKNNNSPKSIRAMQCINKAYEVLSRPAERAEHDKWIEVNEYGCKQANPSPTAPPEYRKPSQFGSAGFKSSFSHSEPPPVFSQSDFPPRNWNPEHFTAFAKYSQAMRRLLDYGDDMRGVNEEHVTLDVLYRAFLMDKRLGNLNHTTRMTARESLIRSFSHVDREPLTLSLMARKFQSLDQSLRKAVILAGLLTLGIVCFIFS